MSTITYQITCFSIVSSIVVQAQIKENIKVRRHWPLRGESTGERWILITKGQQRGKCFHLTSSWSDRLLHVDRYWFQEAAAADMKSCCFICGRESFEFETHGGVSIDTVDITSYIISRPDWNNHRIVDDFSNACSWKKIVIHYILIIVSLKFFTSYYLMQFWSSFLTRTCVTGLNDISIWFTICILYAFPLVVLLHHSRSLHGYCSVTPCMWINPGGIGQKQFAPFFFVKFPIKIQTCAREK